MQLPHGIQRTAHTPIPQLTLCTVHTRGRATRQALKETAHKTGEKASKNLIRRTIKVRCLHLRHDMQRSPGAQHTPAIRCCGALYRRRAARVGLGRYKGGEALRQATAAACPDLSRPVRRLQ